MTTDDDLPIIQRIPPPEPQPNEVRFEPKLEAPPLDLPKPPATDPALAARRARADHLCLWLACSRALCRRARRCLGPHAACVFEQAEVDRPLLEEIVQGPAGRR